MSLIDRWKCVAMRSFDPASTRMKNAVRSETPNAVRNGTLRGRSSTWCSRLSPVANASMNGYSREQREQDARARPWPG